MSKVICDICGTAYPESLENCPVCGCSRDFALDALEEEMLLNEAGFGVAKSGSQPGRKHKEIFDFDEVNQDDEYETEEYAYEDDEDDEDNRKESQSNLVLVVILLVLIVLLLLTAGFFFLRYILPNMVKEAEPTIATTVATEPVETEPEASTEHSVPCTDIVIPGGKIELGKDGKWLMNVQVYPEDTTDVLTYASHDESVVTVTEDGTVTAVGEGKTIIEVTCGNRQIKCNVVVDYSQTVETEASGALPGLQVEQTDATEGAADAADATEAAGETAATETPAETTGKTELKLKQKDITMFAAYSSAELELDCDIPKDSIEWFTMDSTVAIVHNGTVTATGSGITKVYAKYGNQEVPCIVRCTF